MEDLVQYGEVDVWNSPLVTFNTAAGDCEDYAIAKYVALQMAGISAEDLLARIRSRVAEWLTERTTKDQSLEVTADRPCSSEQTLAHPRCEDCGANLIFSII
jgi:hypothetical protein